MKSLARRQQRKGLTGQVSKSPVQMLVKISIPIFLFLASGKHLKTTMQSENVLQKSSPISK